MIRLSSRASSSEEPLLLEFESIKSKGPPLDDGSFGERHWRWSIGFAIVTVLIATVPIWLSFVIPNEISAVNGVGYLALALSWIVITYNAWQSLNSLTYFPQPSLKALPVIRQRTFTHIVVVPCDEESIDVLFDCLGSLLIQDDPQSLFVVVAFESTTPNLLRKEQAIHFAFHDKFGKFVVTIHRLNPLKELAGNCSNKNFALHEAVRHIRSEDIRKAQHAMTVTVCESTSLFHPNYFSTLEKVYNAKNPAFGVAPQQVIWQAPIFYNRNMINRSFFNRITCLFRSMLILGGLIPFQLNPLCIYSYPLELGLDAGFINPRYAADDVLAKVRWMCTTQADVQMDILPVPCLNAPSGGETLLEEFVQWAKQLYDWVVGGCEAVHYFLVHWRGHPLIGGLKWLTFFFLFYGMFVCSSGVFAFLAYFEWPWVSYPWIGNDSVQMRLTACGWMFLGIQYALCAVAFLIDYRVKRMMTVKEDIGILYTFVHWMLTPPVLLVYSMIALGSVIIFAVRGKDLPETSLTFRQSLRKNPDITDNKNAPHDVQQSNPAMGSDSVDDPAMRYQSLEKSSSVLYRMPETFQFGEYIVRTDSIRGPAQNA